MLGRIARAHYARALPYDFPSQPIGLTMPFRHYPHPLAHGSIGAAWRGFLYMAAGSVGPGRSSAALHISRPVSPIAIVGDTALQYSHHGAGGCACGARETQRARGRAIQTYPEISRRSALLGLKSLRVLLGVVSSKVVIYSWHAHVVRDAPTGCNSGGWNTTQKRTGVTTRR